MCDLDIEPSWNEILPLCVTLNQAGCNMHSAQHLTFVVNYFKMHQDIGEDITFDGFFDTHFDHYIVFIFK